MFHQHMNHILLLQGHGKEFLIVQNHTHKQHKMNKRFVVVEGSFSQSLVTQKQLKVVAVQHKIGL